MKKTLFIFIFIFPFLFFGQIQLGNDIDGEATGDQSGQSVSLSSDGSIVAIGARYNDGNGTSSGHVRVYSWSGSSWDQLGADIDGEAANDQSGRSVSLSSDGSIVAIGAALNDDNGTSSGHVRVYSWSGSSWVQLGADIDGEAAIDFSGADGLSLSSDGSIVAIGATSNDGNGSGSGHVRVYSWSGSSWDQLGTDIDGESANDNSGGSVSLSSDGSIVAIGATENDGNGSGSGHVRVYSWSGSSWDQLGADIDGEAAGDRSGWSVSLSSDGSIVAIGAVFNNGNGSNSGHVRVYSWSGSSWDQLGADIDGEAANDQSGGNVSLSGDGSIVAIGAVFNNGNISDSGHVRVYSWSGSSWVQLGADIDGEAEMDDSGFRVSLSSDSSIVAIGAIGNDGNGSASGHVRVYDLSAILASDSFVLSQFSLYPNPVKKEFTIQLKQDLILQKVAVYNNLGQLLHTTTNNIITTTHLSKGIYFIVIETNKGKATKKLIVE
jgi:type IX secretion system substrate protein/FG-GAP repeat protein